MCVPLPGERSEPGLDLGAGCGVRPLAHVRKWTSSHNLLPNPGPAGTFLFLGLGYREFAQKQKKLTITPLSPEKKSSFEDN